MRYDTEHKQKTRTRVLDAAASAIRNAGPDRIGVAGVMAEAGLTHGGFYAHFSSKDELVTAAIEHMFEQGRERFRVETEGRDSKAGLTAYIDFYLSAKHRDMRGAGCPMPTLSSDLPRLGEETRAIYADGVRRLVVKVQAMLEDLGRTDVDTIAQSTVAELIGALAIARIEPDHKRSDAMLAASRKHIKQRLGLDPKS